MGPSHPHDAYTPSTNAGIFHQPAVLPGWSVNRDHAQIPFAHPVHDLGQVKCSIIATPDVVEPIMFNDPACVVTPDNINRTSAASEVKTS